MAGISPTLIDAICESINKELKDNYFRFYYPKSTLSEDVKSQIFKTFIKGFLYDNINDKKADEIFDIRTTSQFERTRTKKRWFSSIQKEIAEEKYKTLGKVIQSVKNLLEYSSSCVLDGVEFISVEDYISHTIDIIEKWTNNKESFLTSFMFMASKTKTNATKAFNIDFLYNISCIIIEKWNGNLGNYIYEIADMTENAFFSPTRILIKPDGESNEDGKIEQYSDYEVSEDYIIRTLISSDNKKDNSDIKITGYYALDEKDCSLINFALSKRDEAFLISRTLVVDIGEAVTAIYESRSSKNYNEVEDRFEKISNYKVKGIIKKNGKIKDTRFSINFFDDVVIETDENTNKRTAKITCNELLRQQYINSQTFKIYSSQIKSFEYPLSKILINILQKQRLDCYKTQNYIMEYPYTYFKQKIRFRSRKKELNMDSIEDSLKEFKEKHIVLLTYTRLLDSFVIEYIPLSNGEKFDFLGIDNESPLSNIIKKPSEFEEYQIKMLP